MPAALAAALLTLFGCQGETPVAVAGPM